MPALPELADRFRDFAATTAPRAPLYARLSARIADDADLLGLLQAAPEAQQIPVLLFAAVHYLMLTSPDEALVAHYPNLAESTASGDPFTDFRRVALGRAGEIEAIVSSRNTQTNEVGRCAQFVPVLALLERSQGSLAMIDVGTSAGLNLLLPCYQYEYDPGGTVGGPSTVHLHCATRGEPPVPALLPAIAAAVGLDVAPIDVRNDAAVRWLEACVWPDQLDRFQRLVAAVELAQQHPPDVRRGDAIDDLGALVAEMGARGHPVVTNSWVLNYLSPEAQQRYVDALDAIGRSRDLSWVIAESPAQTPALPVPTTPEPEDITVLSVVTWRAGARRVHRLATTHPHGFWLHWESPDPQI